MDRREYLHLLEDQIRTRRARPMVLEEVEAHIEDQKLTFQAEGVTDIEAEEAAVREMGDPVEAGVALDRVHRPKMEWSVLAGILFISFMGAALQIIVILTSYPPDGAGRFQRALFQGAGEYTAAMAAGLFLMLIICWLDYSLLGKYAPAFWMSANALMVLCIAAGPPVNGRPLYLSQSASLLIPFYAGILYYFRGQKQKGLIKSGICLGISILILLYNYMLSVAAVVGMTGLILIHAAIHRRWFGSQRKKLYFRLWIFIILTGALVIFAFALKTGGSILPDYQLLRIQAWLKPGSYLDYDYTASAAAEAGTAVREGAFSLAGNMLNEIRNSYLWLYVFRYMGTWKGILLTGLVAAFWIYLLHVARQQKNQLGYIVSLGCVLFLTIQTIMYIGMNLGIVPRGSVFMPFISNGGSYLLIAYFYMGIILSVCRNSRVVKN